MKITYGACLLGLCLLALTYFYKHKGKENFEVTAELEQEVEHQELAIVGNVPKWLSGTLVRNGPTTVNIDGKSNKHWFDGLAMLHAFTFEGGKVFYSNKFLRTEAYQSVFGKGSLKYAGFDVDPCRSLFKKYFTVLFPPESTPLHNANVNVAKLANSYVALTETPLPVRFDIASLKTLGALNYKDALPKKDCWESAHPHQDETSKEVINYLVEFGYHTYYTLYTVNDRELKRHVLTKILVDAPSYMHSFAITEHYIILTEFPFVVKPLDLMTTTKPFINNYSWQPERGTQFTVINRQTGALIGTYKTEPFFAFHHANAFEKGKSIYLDIVTYPDARILLGATFKVDTESKEAQEAVTSRVNRFSLSLDTGEIKKEDLFSRGCEFPRINLKYNGKPYRYLYVTGFTEDSSQKEITEKTSALYKIDLITKQFYTWVEADCLPGEPIFVPALSPSEEDEGLIVTIVIDHVHQTSFLLILDAKTFTEVARCKAPHLVPRGLHGQFFN